MAKTLLNGVNEVLKRTGVVAGDSGVFTSLTDTARQRYIDVAVQVWNEALERLYDAASISLPKEMAEASIDLVENKRDYKLKTDLVALRWPFHNRVDGEYISEWNAGFHDLVISQPQPDDYTGLAYFGAIRPIDGFLYLERIPTSTEAGKRFFYFYDKDVSLSAATDQFPFDDGVFRNMVPFVAQEWESAMNRATSTDAGLGTAAGLLSRKPKRHSWLPR